MNTAYTGVNTAYNGKYIQHFQHSHLATRAAQPARFEAPGAAKHSQKVLRVQPTAKERHQANQTGRTSNLTWPPEQRNSHVSKLQGPSSTPREC